MSKITVVWVLPVDPRALHLVELLKYEYIGLYGEPDPNPEGGLEKACGIGGFTILVLDGEEAVAICGVTRHSDEVYILRRMFTKWESRSQGLARLMLHKVYETVRGLGAEELWLETGTVQTTAIALYTSEGFEPAEPFGYYAGESTSMFMKRSV